MNLIKAFGIDTATDKLCETAEIEKIDWDKLHQEEKDKLMEDAHDILEEENRAEAEDGFATLK